MKTLLFLTVLSVCSAACVFDCEKFLRKKIRPIGINGIVINKGMSETGCFGSIVFMENGVVDSLSNICYCVPEKESLWEYVMAGDSIYKQPGDLKVYIVRDKLRKKIDFPCCSH